MSERLLELSPEVIEGIGPKRATKLADAGIDTLADLLECGPRRCRAILKGTSLDQVRGWLAAAKLMLVDGLDANVAESLVAAGIGTIEELASSTPAAVAAALESGRLEHRLRDVPDADGIAGILRRASKLSGRGIVHGQVLGRADGVPLAAIEVQLGRRRATTDARGRFAFVGVPFEPQLLRIEFAGRQPFQMQVESSAELRVPAVRVKLEPAPAQPRAPRRIDEQCKGIAWVSRNARVRVTDGDLGDLPEGALLAVRDTDPRGHVKLLHLRRLRVGNEVSSIRVRILPDRIPPDARKGSIVRWTGDSFELTDLSYRDVARQKLESVVGPRNLNVLGRRRVIEIP